MINILKFIQAIDLFHFIEIFQRNRYCLNLYFLTVIPVLLFLTGCISYQIGEVNVVEKGHNLSSRCIFFYSDDRILNEIIQKENLRCLEYDTIIAVDAVFLNSTVHSMKSAAYSLSTLTIGTFYEWGSEAILQYQVTDFQGTYVYSEHLPVLYKMRTVMPPYLGLILTISSSILNRYKIPEVIKERCINDGLDYGIFDIKKEDYCTEYRILLEEVWNRAAIFRYHNVQYGKLELPVVMY